MPLPRSTTQQHKCQAPNILQLPKHLKKIRAQAQRSERRRRKKDRRQFGELMCEHVQQAVMSVPESLLRQSVSATVWPSVGEKHFRQGKQGQRGNGTCGCICKTQLYDISNHNQKKCSLYWKIRHNCRVVFGLLRTKKHLVWQNSEYPAINAFTDLTTRWQYVNRHGRLQRTTKHKHWSCQHPHRLSHMDSQVAFTQELEVLKITTNYHTEWQTSTERLYKIHKHRALLCTSVPCALCGSRWCFIRILHSWFTRSLSLHTGAFTCPVSEVACFGWI